MALRKQYRIELLEESFASASFTPFVNGLDNGTVTIYQNGNEVTLSYDDIAKLEATAFPEQSYDCNGNKVDNFATLTQEEREYMYTLYPEERPTVAIQETVS